MAKYKVVVTDLGYQTYDYEKNVLKEVGAEVVLANAHTEDEGIKACKDADGILNRTTPMTAKVIAALEKCKVIARYGVGVDNVDLNAATKKGIVVANVPNYCNDEVSTLAVALMLALARKVVSHDKAVRAGAWDIGSKDPIYRTAGKTLGLVGFGRIARTVAKKMAGFEMKLLAYDPFITPEQGREAGAEMVELETVLSKSDFISIHAPMTTNTKHMINAKTLALMKPTAYLVNTSRGGLVDTAALAKALWEKRIAGAGLDVYEVEPLPMDSPLRKLDNVILTDHAGWYSEDSIVELQTCAAMAVAAVLAGKRPESAVNPEVFARP